MHLDTPYYRLARARHEAGHYVAAMSLPVRYPEHIVGVDFKVVTMEPEEGSLGRVSAILHLPPGVSAEFFDSSLTEEQLVPRMIYLLGGLASGALYHQLFSEDRYAGGERGRGRFDDLEGALPVVESLARWVAHEEGVGDCKDIARLLGPRDWLPFFADSVRAVYAHWDALWRVADALLAKRTLTGEEALAAFHGDTTRP